MSKKMTESLNLKEKHLIGFFPPFHSLADTGRLVIIAKQYRELGGKAIFFVMEENMNIWNVVGE